MKILSINVALPEQLDYRGKVIETGINKIPVDGPVQVDSLNLAGDGQANLEVHGGPYQAVYVYSYENYDYWSGQLGRDDFQPGQFGENLTVSNMLDADIMIGDRFTAGDTEFEVTQPRGPCYKLAMKMRQDNFVIEFRKAGRPGFYCKVIREGTIGPGDEIQYQKVSGNSMSVQDAFLLRYFDSGNYNKLRECAAIPALAPRWRDSLHKLLLKEPE